MGGTFMIDQREFIRQAGNISDGIPTIAVVKNNAYNYGLSFSVNSFLEAGITSFATTNMKEAVNIRDLTLTSKIFLMNPTKNFDDVRAHDIDITLPSTEYYEKYYKELSGLNVHLEYEGRFNRSGFTTFEQMKEVLEHQSSLPEDMRFNLTGLWTHFGYADEFDGIYEDERDTWLSLVARFNAAGIHIPVIHAQNTASYMRDGLLSGHSHLRLGIGLYGSKPYAGLPEDAFLQSSELSAGIIQLRNLDRGSPCGYGASFVPDKDTKIAVVDIGYGDGILKGRAQFECEIDGRYYPIRALMMSHMIVEVDDQVEPDDTVYIYNKNLRIDEFTHRGAGANSEQLGALNYHSLTKEISYDSRVQQ